MIFLDCLKTSLTEPLYAYVLSVPQGFDEYTGEVNKKAQHLKNAAP